MGFNIFDLLPKFGNIQAPFINDYFSSTTSQSYLKLLSNKVRPLTTGLFISSPEIQAAGINVLNQPTYDINCSSGNVSRVDAIPNSLVARQSPSKLDYPYLIVYSSICSQGTNTVYYGSSDGKSKIPAMAFITRNYNQGDFFYAFTQTFSYTATKNFVLSDIETAIMLPNGQKPFLQPNSSVIYKIT